MSHYADQKPENKSRAIANSAVQKKPNEKQGFYLPNNSPKAIRNSPVIQGYFTDERKGSLFGPLKADEATITKVRSHLTAHHPHELENFNRIIGEASKTSLQTWLSSIGTDLRRVELTAIQTQFPQTAEIPPSWVTSTAAHNPGGPPLMLRPPQLDSPTSSQEEEMGVSESDLRATDLVTDISVPSFTYHRTQATYPITPEVRSELRAGAALTNTFIDHSPTPLRGTNTSPIKTDTVKARNIARGQDSASSTGRTFSHHPDTFWTGTPSSGMGWHPVHKNTNTLEGDSHNLSARTGQQLTGMVLKERTGHIRPTLAGVTAHQERLEASEQMAAEESTGLPSLREKIDQAKGLAITDKAMEEWAAIEAVIERLEIAVSEEDEGSLGEMATYYLAMTYDILPESTSSVSRLLVSIAQDLREL